MVDITGFVHGNALFNKSRTDPSLESIWEKYVVFRAGMSKLKILSEDAVRESVKLLNIYRSNVAYALENRSNSGQEALRSTIFEEYYKLLFGDTINSKVDQNHTSDLVIGKGTSYVSISFTPRSFSHLMSYAQPNVHTKDQDFVVGRSVEFSLNNHGEDTRSKFVIPAVAIECKTYLEKNMLDSCAATAKRLKVGMPYCLYIVSSEYLKMENAYPELTDIDEIYILTKESNAQRLALRSRNQGPTPICDDLVVDLFFRVNKHINKLWWHPEEALATGKVIDRP